MSQNNSCGLTTELINGNYYKTHTNVEIYSLWPKGQLINDEHIKLLHNIIISHNKVIISIDIAGWFDHVFTLFQTDKGIFILDSYKYNYDMDMRQFDLDEFLDLLLIIGRYISSDDENYEKFDIVCELWITFWNVERITGSKGPLDYYIVDVYYQE